MDYDILVGVSTKNCEESIESVLSAADKAVQKHGTNPLILVVDGYSTDKTKTIVASTKTKSDVKFMTEKGKKGKGSAIHTILERAKAFGAETTVLIDGDFCNLTSDTIEALLLPVVKGKADVVFPRYVRDKNDCLISNHIIYPLTKALFNAPLRHPLAGEYGLSKKACTKILQSGYFPADQGVGVFITLTAICENLITAEVKVGTKEHCSSDMYKKPEAHVMPMFNQVMKTFIQLMRYYRNSVRKGTKQKVKFLGKTMKKRPRRIEVDVKAYNDLSRNSLKDANEYAEAIYENLNKQNIMGLKVAWLNWLSMYFEVTKNMSNDAAEKEIEKLVRAFVKKKDVLKV